MLRQLTLILLFSSFCLLPLQAKKVILGGESIGIQLKYHGLLVNGHYRLNNGLKVNQHLLKNDRLLQLNGNNLKSLSDIHRYLKDANKVLIERDGKQLLLNLEIVEDKYGYKQHGLYLKEEVLGIATLTYYDHETNHFGALGHEIVDEQGMIVSFDEGYVYEVKLESIIPSSKQRIGQKQASFNEILIGNIIKNCKEGIFGNLNNNYHNKIVETAKKEDIKLGKAYCYIELSEGYVKPYEIEITNVNFNTKEVNKGIELKISDKQLIQQCGGIIQGMSGSPILQEGKLVGALTHVLVNNPTMGYGIFIENMLDATG